MRFAGTVALATLVLPSLVACRGADATEPHDVESDAIASRSTRRLVSVSPASAIESEPHLAQSADGRTLVVAWTARREHDWMSEGHIGYAFSRDGGKTWSAPGVLDHAGHERQVNVKVAAAPDGGFWLVWLGRSAVGTPDAILAAHAPPGASVFGPPMEITSTGSGLAYDLPTVSVTGDGAVLAAYNAAEEGADGPCASNVVARRTASGWSRVVASPCDVGRPIQNINALCADPVTRRVWLAYVIGTEAAMRVEARFSDDGGATFPAVNRVDVSPSSDRVAFNPSLTCTADGGRAWVAYGTTKDPIEPGVFGKLDAIRVARLNARGREDLRDALAPADGHALQPALVRDGGGRSHVVYLAGRAAGDPNATLRFATLEDRRPASRSRRIDGPFLFEQTWGAPGFLGDYFGVVAWGTELRIAHAVQAGDDVHVAFTRVDARP